MSKLSSKRKMQIYRAIHEAVTKARLELKLDSNTDFRIAQIENDISAGVFAVLESKEARGK